MKKLLFLFTVLCGLAVTGVTNASKYHVDDLSVEKMIMGASEAGLNNLWSSSLSNMPSFQSQNAVYEKDPVVAVVLSFFLGGFGIHRHYLGTKDSMWAIYTFTCCGIFGIVPTVDFFVLLIDGVIDGNIDKYIDNEEFFMWAS